MLKLKNTLLLLFLLLPLTLAAQESQQEDAYYYVGWLNAWSTTDKSYPLTPKDDGQWWEITLPATGNNHGWYKIAPASAYELVETFWDNLFCAPFDGCTDLSGTMDYGNQGAWLLPNEEDVTAYVFRMNPTTMEFQITPQYKEAEHDWSGTLPLLYINTEAQAPITSKEEYVTATCYIDALGLEGYAPLGSAEAPITLQIRGRGNYTWNAFDKKPYRLKFSAKTAPFGLNKNKHFVLLAHADDNMAFLRNTVGFELSRRLGLAYTPEQRPVEVVLNGEYLGLYMLTEPIRVDSKRVDITEQNDQETNPDNITGGWLLEIDNYDDDYQIRMTEGNGALLRFTLHSPEILSDAQHDYISQYLQETDHAIYDADKNSTRWEDYIDMDALVKFYLVQEVMDNGESFHGSCYIHKERGTDTKLVFGPVWDFGNAFRRQLDKFIYDGSPFGQSWIGEIARFPRFQEAARQRFQAFMDSDYATLDDYIDTFVTDIAAAAASDYKRWPQYGQDDINGRRDWFKYCLHEKVDWLCQQWHTDTAIQTVTDNRSNTSDRPVYTLDGRQIVNSQSENSKLPKGLYILNGRVVAVK